MQDVFPSIMDVAKCFKTVVVTTSDSARLPGAERYEYDHHHSNIGQTKELAEKPIVHHASYDNKRQYHDFPSKEDSQYLSEFRTDRQKR